MLKKKKTKENIIHPNRVLLEFQIQETQIKK